MHQPYTQASRESSEESIQGCLTGIGVSAWDLVVGFPTIQTRSNDLFEFEHSETYRVRETASNLLAGCGKLVEGGEGVPNHGPEVE